MVVPGPACTPILAPIHVDAFINYADVQNSVGDEDGVSPRAYLSPIPKPNYAALAAESKLLAHDIFDQTRERPLCSNGDPQRRAIERSGVYLHWSLPRTYRTGISASDGVSSDDFDQTCRAGGYPVQTSLGRANGDAIFRDIPNRWVICRQIDLPESGHITIHRPDSNSSWTESTEWNGVNDGHNVARGCSYFVIESNTIRNIWDIPDFEDVEARASPLVDETLPAPSQGQTFLGQSYPLTSWDGDVTPTHTRRTTRVTVQNAVNPYFADFQPQNSSVLSFFDDLTVTWNGATWQICDAKLTYTVVGWHTDLITDPLNSLVSGQTIADRLKACGLQLDNPVDPASPNPRLFCHGSIIDIRVSQLNSSPDKLHYPGDQIQSQFATSHPLSVGTNSMDALFGWLRASDDDQSETAKSLLRLQSFILDANDDLDSQLQAEDLLATNNFITISGGSEWHFTAPEQNSDTATKDTPPSVPSAIDAESLRNLNNAQALLDARLRERQSLKIQMFDCFWKCLADQGKATSLSVSDLTAIRANLRKRLDTNWADPSGSKTGCQDLMQQIQSMQKSLASSGKPVQIIAAPKYFIQDDPTVFVSGLAPQWPKNFNENLKVRTGGELPAASGNFFDDQIFLFEQYRDGKGQTIQKLETNVTSMVIKIAQESSVNRAVQNDPPEHPQYTRFSGSNGWFPLFLEWEVEYYHLPWGQWDFRPSGPESRWGYCLKDDYDIGQHPEVKQDYRILHGRTPLLPQSAASLQATLLQVFSKINPDELNETIDGPTRATLLSNVTSLDYLSTPMSGLTDQLITRQRGSHFNPLIYRTGSDQPIPVPEAQNVAAAIQMTSQDLLDMNAAAQTTPFASLTPIPSDTSSFMPFKPCTHGQFRFTKLNIMDKFGQVVNGITSSIDSAGKQSRTPVFPCLGDAYSIQSTQANPTIANTVFPREDGLNSFVQLPPSINQHARLNVDYVTSGPKGWRHIEEWENPVRGWLMIDYANGSVQIFAADGVFVREYSVYSGKITGRPFAPNASQYTNLDPLMKQLTDEFAQEAWVVRFFQNITRSIEALQSSPSHYAECMQSILGKPLALVTFGFSMQLASPPLTNQSTVPGAGSNSVQSITDYVFPVKIGDKDNVFDGLMGLFNGEWADFDFSKFLTYHEVDDSLAPPLKFAKPFYIDPNVRSDYLDATDSHLNPLCAIVDPFTPVNFYTALLPIQQLKIPPWCISQGLSRIASFFRTGPTLLANDVPDFDPTKAIKESYRIDDPAMPPPNGTVAVPAVNMADWKWLQPYWVSGNPGTTEYNCMTVQQPSEKPLWQTPPYVVTEGYLQMAKPFTGPSAVTAKEQAP